MKLSNRLNEIVKYINDNSTVIDVGCDHGLLDIYLTINKNCNCIATDISSECINKTNNNISTYGLQDKIKTIVSDGLSNVSYKDDDIIVISGMGTSTIKHIVKPDMNNTFIIQSNNDYELLREYFISIGYIISNESVVFDHNKFYITMLFTKGNKEYSKDDLFLGPIMRYSKDSINYYEYLLDKYKKIKNNMPSYNEDEINLLNYKIGIIEKTLDQLRK